MGKQKVTERIIAKAGLSKQEKMIARFYYGSKSAGKRTKYWVSMLSPGKYNELLASAEKKIQQRLEAQKAKRAGE